MTSQPQPRIWLITGATSGFGKRMAISVIRRGDRVIGTGRSPHKISQVQSDFVHLDGLSEDVVKDNFRGLELDVTDEEDVIEAKIKEAVGFWGGIDVLVNNAGVGIPSLVEEGGNTVLRRQFAPNVFGVVAVTGAVLPYLRESKNPALVVIGSRSAYKAGMPGLGPYAASKAAIHAITESWMTELAPFNIPVLLVLPGAFPTEGILSQIYYTSNPIPAYDALRAASVQAFHARPGTEKGDPKKAAEVIVDVVKREGVAKGRDWPNYLVLGEDAEEDIRSRVGVVVKALDEWVDVTRGVSFDT